jgi:hypothetical protein
MAGARWSSATGTGAPDDAERRAALVGPAAALAPTAAFAAWMGPAPLVTSVAVVVVAGLVDARPDGSRRPIGVAPAAGVGAACALIVAAIVGPARW